MLDINKLPFEDESAAKFLTVEACEKLVADMRNFEDAVKAVWYYCTDNKITNHELPAELLELWGAICMYGADNDGRVELLEDSSKLADFIKKLENITAL